MALDAQVILKQIDDLLGEFERARGEAKYGDFSGGLPDHEMLAIATRLGAAIRRLSPLGSEYGLRADDIQGRAAPSHQVRDLGGILLALRADVEAGYTQTLVELVHADVFDDFLELAGELLDKGYGAPAAVVAGSVLEEHLRKLADKVSISRQDANGRPKSVETLSVELRIAGEFSELERKSLQAWYGQRTDGAHHQGANLVDADVRRMIDGIRDFIARHPT